MSKLDIRFTLDFKTTADLIGSGTTTVLTANLVLVKPEGIRNPSSSSWDGESHLCNLVIRAQTNYDASAEDNRAEWYGWKVEYRDVYSVALEDAKRMVKTLGTIDRKLAAMSERRGSPADAADFFGRVAEALGAEPMCFMALTSHGRGWSYDDNEYRTTDVDGLRYAMSAAREKAATA